jgi:hypothetical protein
MRIIRKQIFAPPQAAPGICDYFDANRRKNQRAIPEICLKSRRIVTMRYFSVASRRRTVEHKPR